MEAEEAKVPALLVRQPVDEAAAVVGSTVMYRQELPKAELREFYLSATTAVTRQSEVFLRYLQDNKETHTANSFEKVEFFMLVNLLTRIQTLLSVAALGDSPRKGRRDDRNLILVMRQGGERVSFADVRRDGLSDIRNEAKELLVPLMKVYLKLIEHLKTCAFLLHEINSFASLNSAIDNIAFVVEQTRTEEELRNTENVGRRLEQCVVMLDIVMEEYCLFADRVRKAFPADWCRFVRVGAKDRMRVPGKTARDVRYLLYLRTLLLSRLQVLRAN